MDYVPMVTEILNNKVCVLFFGNLNLICIHKWNNHNFSYLTMNWISLQIHDLVNNDKLKRELLAQLIVKYEGAILEHDASSAALLFEMNDFHWILQIDIG